MQRKSMSQYSNAALDWFLQDLTHRIVAKSGIPSDRYHLGKIIHQNFLDDPNYVLQIDGGTGEEETSGSAHQRSVRCAVALQKIGLKHGDTLAIVAVNHLDSAIPFYAALFLGVGIATIDATLLVNELKSILQKIQPKIVFCDKKNASDVEKALSALEMDTRVITFDKNTQYMSFAEFLDKYGDDTKKEDYKIMDFDPAETIACLGTTSGTVGIPKLAAFTHKNTIMASELWSKLKKVPDPELKSIVLSPLQWLSAIMNYIFSALLRYTRVQTSLPMTPQHIYELINKYKPTHTMSSPTLLTILLKPGEHEKCDFSSFTLLHIGGSAVPDDILKQVKDVLRNVTMEIVYGMTEATGQTFRSDVNVPLTSVGAPRTILQYRLVDVTTGEDIEEPNKPGELWVKGPTVFKGYYNEPERTREILTEDGWLKTGDLLYRDENWYFYFVDRIKLLLKYKNHQISPVELEHVIRGHPAVHDAAVTGISVPEGELPVAFVVRRPDQHVTAQEIKDLVKDSLSETKELRGGVVFVDELPLTGTTKVDRKQLKKLASELKPE